MSPLPPSFTSVSSNWLEVSIETCASIGAIGIPNEIAWEINMLELEGSDQTFEQELPRDESSAT